ncbi:MAG TPA: VWA domain-containing protein [Pyrinomonadaceae bacterium]|jgi:VWFA-related protein
MSPKPPSRLLLITSLLCSAAVVWPQQKPQPSVPVQLPDDVVRVNTELIQSPVIVVDKQGNFVDGLAREQFELTVDGRAQPIAFFEQVAAGSPAEAEKLERARKGTSTPDKITVGPGSFGRTLIFFVDDLHLNAESVYRIRTALTNFIDHSLGQNDRAMVMTTTGQMGFLQQLTDNREVLHAAVERLKYRETRVIDETQPPMLPYQALAIEGGDSGTLRYFADIMVSDVFSRQSIHAPEISPNQAQAQGERRGDSQRSQAENYVRNRAKNLLTRYSAVSAATFAALKQSVSSLDQIPGSKLLFMMSDGFFLNRQMPGELQKLNEITSGAMRSGAMVYAIQASGLGNAFPDASTEARLSPRMERASTMVGEDTALQAPLYTLASDTGGQAFFNTNSIDRSIATALQETAKYYLLAWRPEQQEKRADLFHRVQVTVKGHPEWSVRVQRGYYLAADAPKVVVQPAKVLSGAEVETAQSRADNLRETLSALYPVRDLPTIINLSFSDQPGTGALLNVGTELMVSRLPRGAEPGSQPTAVDLAGVVLNDEGKTVASFGGRLKFDLDSSSASRDQTVSHVDEIRIKPGLYQVRVAVREEKSGISGSAAEWIRIPDLNGGAIALSSLLVGDVGAGNSTSDQKARLSINHHFVRSGRLRFLTYIYNASRATTSPDVTVQLRVMRDDTLMSTSSPIKLNTSGLDDPARIPYAAELKLQLLPPGRYTLLVTATDNASKSSASQSVKFVVE